ncbi:MAG: ParA family protein, partial [Actinomycetota bacterium]|nr:ParA family protein [Actinomycetota bacterium]
MPRVAPRKHRPDRGPRECGQATVELVALLPLVAVLAGILWQATIVGQAVWLSGSAARAAARASAIGDDARAAARRVLPARLERRLV